MKIAQKIALLDRPSQPVLTFPPNKLKKELSSPLGERICMNNMATIVMEMSTGIKYVVLKTVEKRRYSGSSRIKARPKAKRT
jgi:hypothetical protein